MGKPILGNWENNYDSAQLQVQTSPPNFKRGTSIQRFQEICDPQSLDPICGKFDKFLAHGKAHIGQMGKWPWQCTTRGLENSTKLRMEKIRQAVTKIWVPQVWQPPARPPARPDRDNNTPPARRERERLSLSAFLRTEDIGVHIDHISRLIITYTSVLPKVFLSTRPSDKWLMKFTRPNGRFTRPKFQ